MWWDTMVCMWEKVGNRETDDPTFNNGMVRMTEPNPRIVRLWECDGAGDLS